MSTTRDGLQIAKLIRASREDVYRAWTDARLLSVWCAPQGCSVTAAESDPRVGGRFELAMDCGGGKTRTDSWVYREVVPDAKLVFTTRREALRRGRTAVTVVLSDKGLGTQLSLAHEGFTSASEARGSEEDWVGALDKLQLLLEGRGPRKPRGRR